MRAKIQEGLGDLQELLNKSLKNEARIGEFKVEIMPANDQVYIGHTGSIEGPRLALILTPFPEHLADLKFAKLHFETLKFVILDVNGNEEKLDSIGVLSLPRADIDQFLHIAFDLRNLLSSGGTAVDYYELIREWANILAAPTGASKETVLGLWGELVVLSRFIDVEYAVNSWHVNANSNWDFSLQENLPLEVKTTSTNSRIHGFSSHQLNSSTPRDLIVCSLLTTEIDNGTSVAELFESISTGLAPAAYLSFVRKVRKVVSLLDPSTVLLRWDFVRACNTLKYYSAADIPALDIQHPIVEASWRSDITDVVPKLNSRQATAIRTYLSRSSNSQLS